MVSRTLCFGLALCAAPVDARSCALALLFALDVSASVNPEEFALQRDGLAAALIAPEVAAAVLAQPGGVAFAAYEWSGRYQQDEMLPWVLVSDAAGIAAVAGEIAAHQRSYAEFPTAIGYALGYGSAVLRKAPPCARQVIDISGDGIHNEGFPPDAAYREFDFYDVTVNGLAIDPGDGSVIDYYRDNIPHGPGAFVEEAHGFEDYADAIRRKLLREILGPQLVLAE